MMSGRALAVSTALGVSVPKEYADFLEEYGIYERSGIEVYGLDDRIIDQDKIPCVIGATRTLRRNAGLSEHYLAIHHTGYEGEVVCVDSKTGEVFLLAHGETSRIAASFSAWFSTEILGKKRRGS
jgi:hypothetical protein